ncbi:polyprenyl diphosphate synthase [Nocardia seriolae]|nr:polyprenyl diphosphate synthase [Nocardia seriolae]PSK26875.1 polyprenyl synthetase family protein [Nocardia seriolae]QOW37696.1 polyprenyl synthetase family protein [Nocardia seriolae]
MSPRIVRSSVLPVIQQQVSTLEPSLARVCRYHLGFADKHGDSSVGAGGKLTRAGLMMAAADGFGLKPEDLLAPAAAVELLHNATLIHDDIIDADELRRGRPAAWKAFGTSLAILAGNALQALALRMVVDDSGPGHEEIVSTFTEAMCLVHAGQARELAFQPDPGSGVAEYERIVAEKNSALLEISLGTPAVRAGNRENALAALRSAGRHLGFAFQISNDVEDIWGDPAVTGKPARGDIRRRNPTFPVLVALSADSQASAQLTRLWHSDDTATTHLQSLADLIEEAGGRHSAQQLCRRHLDSAVEHLGRAKLSSTATTELTTLFGFVVNRTA